MPARVQVHRPETVTGPLESSQRAAEQLRPDNLDAGLLMWFLRRRVRVDRLPADRVTVQFEFRDAGSPG